MALAVAVTTTAIAAASAHATYYFIIDHTTGLPCSDVTENSNGTLSGGCVVSMSVDEQTKFGGDTCEVDFDLRFAGWQRPNFDQVGDYAIYVENVDVTGGGWWCQQITAPVGNPSGSC